MPTPAVLERRVTGTARPGDFDVAVIGAGVAGTGAASALSQAGLNVVLIDFRDRHLPEFRAEKIGERQIGFFDSFGLGLAARRQMTAFDGVWVHRFGRIVEKSSKREYSSPYGDLVNALRDALSPSVTKLTARISAVRTSPERQEIELSDGSVLRARLLVVATGAGDTIRSQLGIERQVTSPNHSVSLGFDLANPASDFPFSSLVWITERPADKTAYITLFPMHGRIRANLFVYRTPNDPWCMQFRKAPDAPLRQLFPDFEKSFAPMRVNGPIQVRPVDIATVTNHRQAGVVLVGDAHFTSCPVSGSGMDKALHDVARLAELVPLWFESPGMSADKVNQFYDHPAKLALDAESLKVSLRERDIRMAPGIPGTILRLRRNVLRRGAYRVRDMLTPLRGRAALTDG